MNARIRREVLIAVREIPVEIGPAGAVLAPPFVVVVVDPLRQQPPGARLALQRVGLQQQPLLVRIENILALFV
jgi:hypothetical protein